MTGRELLEHLSQLADDALDRPVVYWVGEDRHGCLCEAVEVEAPEGTNDYAPANPTPITTAQLIIIS